MGWLLRYSTTQGTTATVEMPLFTGSPLGNWNFTVCFVCKSLASQRYLVGNDTDTPRSVSINSNGSITWASVGLTTAAGIVSVGVKTWVRLSSDLDGGKFIRTSTDGITYTLAASGGYVSANMLWSRIGSAGAIRSRYFDFYEIVTTAGGGYADTWNTSTSTGTGTSWLSLSGTRSITLTNFTGAADSWWVSETPAIVTPLKYWNGSAWVTKPLKYWNGSAWVEKPLKYHNGTGWS